MENHWEKMRFKSPRERSLVSNPRVKGKNQHKKQKALDLEVKILADQNQSNKTCIFRQSVSTTSRYSCSLEGARRYMMAGKMTMPSKTEAGQTCMDLKIKAKI